MMKKRQQRATMVDWRVSRARASRGSCGDGMVGGSSWVGSEKCAGETQVRSSVVVKLKAKFHGCDRASRGVW